MSPNKNKKFIKLIKKFLKKSKHSKRKRQIWGGPATSFLSSGSGQLPPFWPLRVVEPPRAGMRWSKLARLMKCDKDIKLVFTHKLSIICDTM
jgi:hypothetical protein